MLFRLIARTTVEWNCGTYCKESQDNGRDGKRNGVEDDHVEDPPEVFGVAHDQMESRVQNQGLRDNHDPPTGVDEDDGHPEIRPHLKIGHEDGQRLDHDAP